MESQPQNPEFRINPENFRPRDDHVLFFLESDQGSGVDRNSVHVTFDNDLGAGQLKPLLCMLTHHPLYSDRTSHIY